MVTRALAFLRRLEPRTALTASDAVKFAMWPIAILTVINKVFVQAVNGFITDDFHPVYEASLAFLNHRPVYSENLNTVDPHYLYPPGGTLLIAPLAIVDPALSRYLFIVLNAAAVLLAWYLLLRLFTISVNSVAAPIILFLMFISETVVNTLRFTNVNGCLLAAEVIFLMLLLRRRDLWAGVALGLTIVVKPILFPLLLLALARRQWKVFITAVGVPLVMTALAWPLTKDPMDFVHHTAPYILQSRDYANSSIVGSGLYFGLPTPLIWFFRVLFGVLVAVICWLLYRYYRDDELFFVCTGAGVLMTALFLLSSLGQAYYSMTIFPLLMTVTLRNSVMRNWPAWLAASGFLSYDQWLLHHDPARGRYLEYLRFTFGWGLLIVVVFCVLGDRYLTARREGRLAGGIDPVFPSETPVPTPAATLAPPPAPVADIPRETVPLPEPVSVEP